MFYSNMRHFNKELKNPPDTVLFYGVVDHVQMNETVTSCVVPYLCTPA